MLVSPASPQPVSLQPALPIVVVPPVFRLKEPPVELAGSPPKLGVPAALGRALELVTSGVPPQRAKTNTESTLNAPSQ
jgi:hypothetical protein